MNRENNNYYKIETGEVLNAFQMNQFITNEAKRQYEECSGESWQKLTENERQHCILEQWEHQIMDMGWDVITA